LSITLDGSNVSTVGVINSGTAQATTSGTSVIFSGIPAGTKRIVLIFNGVSTSGTSNLQMQIGSGSLTTSGYASGSCTIYAANSCLVNSATTGIAINDGNAANIRSGHAIFTNVSGNIWVASYVIAASAGTCVYGGGNVTLSGTLDRIALTTVNGTDTFDAGSVNIQYE